MTETHNETACTACASGEPMVHAFEQRKITADMAGVWLDGARGWYNTCFVVDIAQEWGFPLELEAELIVNAYRNSADTLKLEEGRVIETYDISEYANDIADDATEYLNSLAPEGFWFEWDMGELRLTDEPDES